MSNGRDETTDDETALAPRTNQLMRRGFAGVELASENAATQAMIAKATADVQSRWIMAMRMPRDIEEVRQLVLRECRRPGFADVATYSRPVGKKYNDDTGQWEEQFADGLSIRFAEVALRCMTNMGCETVTIFDSLEERIVRVTVTDFESNGTWSRDITIKKTVERKKLKKGQKPIGQRENSYGDLVFIVQANDSEVAVKEAAEISKASRTGILRLVPGHIQDEAFDLCRSVAADKAAKDPAAALRACLDAFDSINVGKADLEAHLGIPVAKAAPAQIATLRKVYAAIRDGELTWADYASAPAAPPAKQATATSTTPAPPPAQPTANEQPRTPPMQPIASTPPSASPPPASRAKGVAGLKETVGAPASSGSASAAFSKAKDVVREKDAARPQPDGLFGQTVVTEQPCKDCGVPISDLNPGARCEACANA